jgi:predicted  nucleic acid-binding Zn-ribbon protein
MLYKYDDLKKMIMEVMKNQTEINKQLQELKTEIQNTKEEMKKEIQNTKEEIQLINQRLKKLEDSFNKSRNAQIACFKDLVNKMENSDM